jgi:phospholipid/cholesterol/gamma-HCH transport system substrate-binding protein
MRAKDKSNLVTVGFFITGLVAVLMVLVVSIGKETSLFERKVLVTARVGNADKLKTGAVVELKGLRVGYVEDILIASEDTVEITLLIKQADLRWIKKDSQVLIANAGLVGDKLLEITAGSREAGPFDPARDVLTGAEGVDLKNLAVKGTEIASTTERLMHKAEALIDQLEAAKLRATMDNLAKSAHSMAPAAQKMDQAMGHLASAAERLDGVLARVQKGPGSIHDLVYDDQVYENLRKLLGGAERNAVIKYFVRESIKNANEGAKKKP